MVTYTYQVLYTTGLGPYLLRKELLKQAMLLCVACDNAPHLRIIRAKGDEFYAQ